MKINKIKILNYKSIKLLEVEPNNGINVFIGENSVGKSNIFDAVNWLLGPVYPTFNHIKKEDHYMGEFNNMISIDLKFDDGKTLQLAEEWFNNRGDIKQGLNIDSNYITDEIRKRYTAAYLGVERHLVDYLPANKWSLLGRFLLDVNERFSNETTIDTETGEVVYKHDQLKKKLQLIRDELLFSVKGENDNNIMKDFADIIKTESARQMNRSESDFNIDFNLYDPWNFYRTLQLLVNEPQIGLTFQASELGMGVQASISIAILKAYSKLKLKNNTPIFIDEPELFLHPHAQRSFYNVLKDLAESGTQLFITTHSPNFLSVADFDKINVIRRTPVKGTYIKNAKLVDFKKDIKIRLNIDAEENDILSRYSNAYDNTADSQHSNEAFFSKKIILVEGQSETLILPYLFKLAEFDYFKEGISIVRCGCKNEIDRFYRLYSEFGIPCYIIFDGDEDDVSVNNRKINNNLLKLLGSDAEFPDGKVNSNYLGFKKQIGDNLNLSEGNKLKGYELCIKVKKNIKRVEQLPTWIKEVIDKLNLMTTEACSVLQK